jgi:cell division septal protein FtsQ
MVIPQKKDINNTPLQSEILKRNREKVRRQKFMQAFRTGLKYFLILSAVSAVIAMFLTIPFFNISDIEINDLNYVSKEDV